ncbi:MAG TPA: phosphatidylglycerophosphatase A, partial [Steroidobacteraceae bacterium]|nr:phosphatidylglycerophosphatase A [Steroidobacteraceae bacterium]
AALYYFITPLQSLWVLGVCCIVVLVIGTVAADVIALKLGEHDPSVVVIDEVLGQWIACFTWVYKGDLTYVIIAFIAFRAFDIFKTYPASIFEKREGGSAVMLDDAVAGVYANIIAHLTMFAISALR